MQQALLRCAFADVAASRVRKLMMISFNVSFCIGCPPEIYSSWADTILSRSRSSILFYRFTTKNIFILGKDSVTCLNSFALMRSPLKRRVHQIRPHRTAFANAGEHAFMPALKAGTQNRTPVFRSSDHELSPGPRDHPSPAQLNHLYLLQTLIRGDPQSSVRIRGRDFCFWALILFWL